MILEAILLSIRPEWAEKILSGEKTMELRKNRPRCLLPPFRCYVYQCRSKGKRCEGDGKIIGEFTCSRLHRVIRIGTQQGNLQYCEVTESTGRYIDTAQTLLERSCLERAEMEAYLNGEGYFWEIEDLIRYDTPLVLSDFHSLCPNYLYCESCAMYDAYSGHCGNEWSRELHRPPQSWCYVERLQEKVDRFDQLPEDWWKRYEKS